LLTESQDKYDSRDLEKLQKDDALVEGYLTWRHFVVEDTLKMIDESLQWRKEFNLNDLVESSIPRWMFESGAVYLHGYDKEGNKLFWFRVKLHVKDAKTTLDKKRYVAFWLERYAKREPGMPLTVVFDMTESGLSNIDMDFVKYIINCFKVYYPKFLSKMIMYEMPWIMNAAWKIVKTWLGPDAISKLKFVTKSDIQTYIDPEHLPPYMGGTDQFKYSYPPLLDDDFQSPISENGPIVSEDESDIKDIESESKDTLESSFNSEQSIKPKKHGHADVTCEFRFIFVSPTSAARAQRKRVFSSFRFVFLTFTRVRSALGDWRKVPAVVKVVNFIEDGQKSDELDRGEPGRLRGARKPTTTFKGTLLHIRKSELGDIKSDLRDRKSELGDIKSDLRDIKSDLRDRKSDLRDRKSDLRDRKSDLQDRKSDLRVMKLDLRDMKSEMRDRKSDLRDRKSDLRDMKSDLRDRKSDLRDMKSDLRDMKSDLRDRKSDLEMKSDLRVMKSDLRDMKSDLRDRKSDLRDRKSDLRVMKSDLRDMNPAEELSFGAKESDKKCLIILNNVTKNHVAFKVRTTAPEKYRVKPSNSSCEPGASVDIVVSLHGGFQASPQDRFLVMAAEMESSTGATIPELSQFWKEVSRAKIMEHRLRCHVLESPKSILSNSFDSPSVMPTNDQQDLQTMLMRVMVTNSRLEQKLEMCLWMQKVLLVLLSFLLALSFTTAYSLWTS
ncbi:Motile sperm domain-containing protein 2, partial [Anabarilius grahami]